MSLKITPLCRKNKGASAAAPAAKAADTSSISNTVAIARRYVVRVNPRGVNPDFNKAIVSLWKGDFQAASTCFAEAVGKPNANAFADANKHPYCSDVKTFLEVQSARAAKKYEYSEIIVCNRKILELDPRNQGARNAIISGYVLKAADCSHKKQYSKAKVYILQAVSAHRTYLIMHTVVPPCRDAIVVHFMTGAEQLVEAKNYEYALVLYEAALVMDPIKGSEGKVDLLIELCRSIIANSKKEKDNSAEFLLHDAQEKTSEAATSSKKASISTAAAV
jgi:tetratricopeptide (TPR) repeat protein